jgi:hypothetical protein
MEMGKRILIVRVDGHPLRALGGGIDRVEADSDFAFEVTADCIGCQAEPLAGFLILGTVVVMAATSWMGSVGLKGVSTPVNEEVEVISHYAG